MFDLGAPSGEESAQEPECAWSVASPGGATACELEYACTRPAELSDAALVEAFRGFERMLAWSGACQAELLAEFARRRPPDPRDVLDRDNTSEVSRWAPDEVGMALTLSPGAASARLAQSVRLARVLPATLAAWRAGELDASRVRAIHDATLSLSDAAARAVEARVLPRALRQTVGQLRAALARVLASLDPEGADERHRRARDRRRVLLNAEQDGMASLWAQLPAPDALSCMSRLTQLARGLGADDPRSMDARRADLLVALVTGTLTDEGSPAPAAAPGKPLVHVVVPLTTLTGHSDLPGELAGYGPIPAALAREIAADGVWKRLVTDPLSGALLDHGRTTYRPPAALADFVRARDVECRAPHCRRRILDAELDHAVAYAEGGETSEHNLHGDCIGHHHLKHSPGWSVVQHADARVTWISPTGHRYTSEPWDYRPEPDLEAAIAEIEAGMARAAHPPDPGPPQPRRPRGDPFLRPQVPPEANDLPPF